VGGDQANGRQEKHAITNAKEAVSARRCVLRAADFTRSLMAMRGFPSLCFALGFGAATLAAAQPSNNPTIWYVITSGTGAPIGYGSTEVVLRHGGQDVIETQAVFLQEQGEPATNIIGRTVFSQDPSGRTLSINAMTRMGRFVSRTDVRIEGDAAHIVSETPSGRWRSTTALNPSVRFDGGEGLLPNWSPTVTPRLEFDNFSVDAMSVDHVVIQAQQSARGAEQRSALRFEYNDGGLVGVTQLTVDRDGRLVESAQPMFGSTLHLRVTDERTALAPHLPYPLIPNSAVRSPVRISASAAQAHIRYTFSFRDGIAFTPPQTGEQRVVQQDDRATVDICEECGPGLATDRAALADALRPTLWMQSDDPRLRAIAAPVAAMTISDAQKMRLLLQRAKPYIARPDYAGHYSALDTISRRAGDCTEAAVLLAALGRAAGIPTRVASGLVYTRQVYFGVSSAFLPHSWTLAYVDGRWRSFDLALESFDSTHIALTVGNGDARSIAAASQLASLLRFDSLAEVRPVS
jgi:hypothetical protein